MTVPMLWGKRGAGERVCHTILTYIPESRSADNTIPHSRFIYILCICVRVCVCLFVHSFCYQDEIVLSLQESELQREYQELGFMEEKEGPRENAAAAAVLSSSRSSEDAAVDNPLRPPPVDKHRYSDFQKAPRNSCLNERIQGIIHEYIHTIHTYLSIIPSCCIL